MQPKVSMVMPCYNKAGFIANMFDSILAQKWDNIELILINDGSTDATRGIIAEYEPRLLARGYEVVIIDQENKGVASATYEGLRRITGEFVCQIDADDELAPEYVSALAGILCENDDYEWAACEICFERGHFTQYTKSFPLGAGEFLKPETFLLCRMGMSGRIYMIRTSYLRYCRVTEHFHNKRPGSQECQLILPLLAGKGRLKYIDRPLYTAVYSQPQNHHSYYADFNSAEKHFTNWYVPAKETIRHLPLSEDEKRRLATIADFSLAKKKLSYFDHNDIGFKRAFSFMQKEYCDLVNACFSPPPEMLRPGLLAMPYFILAVEDNILGLPPGDAPRKAAGRVIAWGALGARGRRILPVLAGTPLEPDELWDIADGGAEVKKPDPGGLKADDLVLVLPKGEVSGAITAGLAGTDCEVMLSDEVLKCLAHLKYPQFYDGSVKFTPTLKESILCSPG